MSLKRLGVSWDKWPWATHSGSQTSCNPLKDVYLLETSSVCNWIYIFTHLHLHHTVLAQIQWLAINLFAIQFQHVNTALFADCELSNLIRNVLAITGFFFLSQGRSQAEILDFLAFYLILFHCPPIVWLHFGRAITCIATSLFHLN